MRGLNNIRKLSSNDYILILEGLFFLLLSDFLIFVVPFRWWVNWIGNKHVNEEFVEISEEQKNLIKRIRRNLFRANRILINSSRCFALSLSLKKMLKRRGVHVTLLLGIKKTEKGDLRAHAWIKRDNIVIYGGQYSDKIYTNLVSFC